MKKTGSKRVSGNDTGMSSAVLEAPEPEYAPESETRSSRQGRGPAPAGALQRGYGRDDFDDPGRDDGTDRGTRGEPEYVPRRGNSNLRTRGIPRSLWGRIGLGIVAAGLLGGIGVAIAGARFYALHDARFTLETSDDIQIAGAEHLTRDQVLNVFGADLERNIFRVSLGERKADLERLPWVEHAAVMRLLPNHIRVQITERTPVAFVRQGTQIGLVDANGVLLDLPPETAGDPHYSFPVLTGILSGDPIETRAARMDVYEQFMAALRGAGEHLTDSLSEVDVSDPEDVKALIASGGSDILVHFGNEDFLKRYHEFQQNLPVWKQQYPKLASADMRYDGQIVLEMQGGAGAGGAKATAAVADDGIRNVDALTTAAVPSGEGRTAVAKAMMKTKTPAATRPASKVTVKKAVARKPVVKRFAMGGSAANQREFAALAAAHRAALARAAAVKAAKSSGATR